MTLDKAIELLNIAKEGFPVGDVEDYYIALELGIEALRQVKESRFDPSTWEPKLLPGETPMRRSHEP